MRSAATAEWIRSARCFGNMTPRLISPTWCPARPTRCSPLATDGGPEDWQCDVLQQLGQGLADPAEAVRLAVASGHGIGKSALLEHALAAAPGLRTLRVEGAQFAMELPYAALHQLCAPLLDLRHPDQGCMSRRRPDNGCCRPLSP